MRSLPWSSQNFLFIFGLVVDWCNVVGWMFGDNTEIPFLSFLPTTTLPDSQTPILFTLIAYGR
jgi:hypothetical protein